MNQYDVIIVGLGPTGGTLANLLALNGFSILILEREKNLYALPRAVHFDDEIMRVFQTIGITKKFLKNTIINKGTKFVNSDGKVGIGSISPAYVLDTVFAGDDGVRLRSTDNHSSFYIQSAAGYGGYIRFTDGPSRYWINATSDDKLRFRPNATSLESATINFDATGNVGIGVLSPSQKLEVGTNTDVSAQIGRAHVGYVGFGDYAGFAHLDKASTSAYALIQGAAGDTHLNAANGQNLFFRQNHVTVGGFNTSSDFYVDTDTLFVDVGGMLSSVLKL